jgi:hypothetical protein
MTMFLTKLCMLVSAVVGVLALTVSAASAGAIVTPSPANFTATGTTGSKLTLGSMTISCTTESATGTIRTTSGPPNPFSIGTFTPQFPAPGGAGCTTMGIIRITVRCSVGTVWPSSITFNMPPGTTPLQLRSLSCVVSVDGTSPVCRVTISGDVSAQYVNPAGSPMTPSGPGTLTIFAPPPASNQSLASSGSTCTAFFPNGASATFTNSSGGNLSYNVVVTGTSTGPVIVVT